MPPKAAATNKRPPKVIDPLEYQRKKEDLLPIDASLASKFSTKLEGTYIWYIDHLIIIMFISLII